jgi:hypothetical protein
MNVPAQFPVSDRDGHRIDYEYREMGFLGELEQESVFLIVFRHGFVR